jgi:integrase
VLSTLIKTTALTVLEDRHQLALCSAIELWSDSTTSETSLRRIDLIRDKRAAVRGFFSYTQKLPFDVDSRDVNTWRAKLETRLKAASVYAQISKLSSFYEWLMKDARFEGMAFNNPVKMARPKAPRAYQSDGAKAWSDEQARAMVSLLKGKADSGDLVAKRDYALLLFFLMSGRRRNEVISLAGNNLELRGEILIVRCRVKGSDYIESELRDSAAIAALLDYLQSAGRMHALKTKSPLWTRHDLGGKPGEQLTSHAFDRNLKMYAREAGLPRVHIHQLRHMFARIVSEELSSITETQDALGHKHASTTRVYVPRITVKKDKVSGKLQIDWE